MHALLTRRLLCTLTLRFALYRHFYITQPDWSIWRQPRSGINFDGRVIPLQCSSARDFAFLLVCGIERDSAWFACHVVETLGEQSLVGVMKPSNVQRRPRGRSSLGVKFQRIYSSIPTDNAPYAVIHAAEVFFQTVHHYTHLPWCGVIILTTIVCALWSLYHLPSIRTRLLQRWSSSCQL